MKEHNRKMKKRQSLSDQLIRMVMFTFLPVNFLAIAVSSIILAKASWQVREFCQRDLDTVMNQIQADLLASEDAFSDFFLDYLTQLTLSDVSSPTAPYDMLTDLHDDFKQSNGDGVYYLYDKKGDRLYLRHTMGVYPVLLIEELKETLLEQCRRMEERKETAPAKWRLCPLKGEYFLGRQYDYVNYRIGFLLDVERLLDSRGTSRLWKENSVYLSDNEAMTYSYGEGHMKSCQEESFEGIFAPGLFEHNVLWKSNDPDICVGIVMVGRDFRGGVPAAYRVLLWVSLASVLLSVVMIKLLKSRVVKSLLVLWNAMDELEKEHLSFRITQWDEKQAEEFVYLYERFNHMAQEIELSREKDIRMYQIQLDNLRLQVNPHMLLNSFNMIYCLAQSKNFDCIQQYSSLLVKYFRYALKDTGQLVLLEKEMEFVEDYINIQKIRFPGAFTTVYTIQDGCGEAMVPPLLVENFVENAMKYALDGEKTIEVLINIRKEEGRLFISVCDTGRGIRPEILECMKRDEIYVDKMGRQHIGVWNCKRRLEIFYHGEAKLNIISKPGSGTQVWLEMPFWTKEEADGRKGESE